MPFQVGHHGVLRGRAIVLRLCHLRLGLHGPELQDPLRPPLVQVEVLLPIEEGLAHVDLVSAAISRLVLIKLNQPIMLGLGVIGREVVIRLESLVMRI